MGKKGITKITFGAEQPFNGNGMERLGLVVWMDRERVAEIIAALRPTPSSPELHRGEN